MKGRLTAAVAAVVLLGAGIAIAVGTLGGDAMISKSYFENTYLPALTEELGQRAQKDTSATYQQAEDDLEKLGKAHLKKAGAAQESGYTPVAAKAGDGLELKEGACFLLYDGAGLVSRGTLADVTAGTGLEAGQALSPAHRYIVTSEDGAALSLTGASSLGCQGDSELVEGVAVAVALPFADVPQGQWYHDAVAFVYSRGYFSGTAADAFSPNAPMDRAMVATVLYRLSGAGSPGQGTAFEDVPAGQWYSDAIAWASANGVVNGMGSNRYAPRQAVTREQLVTMLYRYEKDYRKVAVPGTGDLGVFPDEASISAWARDAMSWAVGAGLLKGRDSGHLDPAGTATRAEVATILQRFSQGRQKS